VARHFSCFEFLFTNTQPTTLGIRRINDHFGRWSCFLKKKDSAMLAGLRMLLNMVYGQDVTGIKTLGALPGALPPISTPQFDLETIRTLLGAAIAVTALALTEAVAIARSIAVKSGQRIDGNQEFVGQGLSNVAGAFFSAYPSSGSFNRSGVNYEAGAKTPLAAVLSVPFLITILFFVAPLLRIFQLPQWRQSCSWWHGDYLIFTTFM
jgi:SulP family sulfate permease